MTRAYAPMPPGSRWGSIGRSYDSMYLALAHRIDARLVTADIRFVNALAKTEHGGVVVALSRVADELSA